MLSMFHFQTKLIYNGVDDVSSAKSIGSRIDNLKGDNLSAYFWGFGQCQ